MPSLSQFFYHITLSTGTSAEQIKGSDTSTAESGSEAESPKVKIFSHLRLTPVREEVRMSFYSIYFSCLSYYFFMTKLQLIFS